MSVNNIRPCLVLEQGTLTSQSTVKTQEAVALSGHDCKIVDREVKPQNKQGIARPRQLIVCIIPHMLTVDAKH